MCVNILPLLNLVIETQFTGSALEIDNKNTPEFKECLRKLFFFQFLYELLSITLCHITSKDIFFFFCKQSKQRTKQYTIPLTTQYVFKDARANFEWTWTLKK